MADLSGDVTLSVRGKRLAKTTSPRIFQSAVRGSAEAEGNAFLPRDFIEVEEAIDLSPAARSTERGREPQDVTTKVGQVLILEMADGVSVITSPEKLRETIQRVDPGAIDAAGKIVLQGALRDRSAATRGPIADGIEALITRFFKITVGKFTDPILEAAKAKLAEWVGGKVEDVAELGVSWLGTKALMWAIEQRLDRDPGLYRWTSAELTDQFGPDDPRLGEEAEAGELLVFVHGTGSNTTGSFHRLQTESASYWRDLEHRYGDRIYAFEHRTLSESPIENALQLARVLPPGARVHLVTHSRGGLVGDLLCLEPDDNLLRLIESYALDDRMLDETDGAERERLIAQLKLEHKEQRKTLVELHGVLLSKKLQIERYVRVACPAHGTRLASANIDVFLSGLLTVIGWIPALQGNPVYSAFKRAVLEIVKNRTKAHLVPGLEAMLPESPMGRFLEKARVRESVKIGVIAGDTEGDNFLSRLGLFFTDFMFDGYDNDLVVDTDSMYAGIARPGNAHFLFDQGRHVTHFGYFTNVETRAGIRAWLTKPHLEATKIFSPLLGDESEPTREEELEADQLRIRTRGGELLDELPIVVVLPGIMGSHLCVNGHDRVWFSPTDIATGGFDKIRWGRPNVDAEKLFSFFYGRLCDHLLDTHRVERFPYDWRLPLDALADHLAQRLTKVLDGTPQPVRLLAHSMGGLVVRALIHKHADLWEALMQRKGARFVMLGTPNQGSYAMVEALIGKSAMLRSVAVLDGTQSLQAILSVVGEFRGALQLLPRPGFNDTGVPSSHDYFEPTTWVQLKAEMRDFWFGDGISAVPTADALSEGAWLWERDVEGKPFLPNAHADKVAYVHGWSPKTPCGITKVSGRWKMMGTNKGDGSVTWDSGNIDGIGRRFWMPADHGSLADTKAYFDSLVELLERGTGGKLMAGEPGVRGDDLSRPVAYDAGPPIYRSSTKLSGALMSGVRGPRANGSQPPLLKVKVVAMDLRNVTQPLLVGHYDEDPIAGAEALVDRYLVRGELQFHHNLGAYPGPIGTATTILRAPNEQERLRGSFRGAVIAGLGKYDGRLTLTDLTAAVRAAGLRYLLDVKNQRGEIASDSGGLVLASLLLGYRSSAQFTVADSVGAVIRGIVEANRKFAEQHRLNDDPGAKLQITSLELVEIYLDTAISATYAAQRVAELMNADTQSDVIIEVAPRLENRDGSRQRLEALPGESFWPRLIVTDADRELGAAEGVLADESESTSAIAQRLRFLYLGQRARAETVVQQRQPGLVEKMVATQLRVRAYHEDFSRSLFQLLVPPDFKEATRQLDRVVIVLDAYTANLPWELMLADDAPLVTKVAMIRQLASTRFRRQMTQAVDRHAYVIGNPSSEGYWQNFPSTAPAERSGLDSLPAAEEEATEVANVLMSNGFEVEAAIGEDQRALDVIPRLYKRPYRIVHIAAHGVFEERASDGELRTGVVLSEGQLITSAEIAAMENVPELVFLNCCHLARVDVGEARRVAFNKLASSVSRELIEIGVRAVVAAGWAVGDESGKLFAQTFYGALLSGSTFGEAVFRARKAAWAKFASDPTWGAFQAYGDPEWRVTRTNANAVPALRAPDLVATEELLGALSDMRSDIKRIDETLTPATKRSIENQAKALLERSDAHWLARPDVNATLGDLYGDLGTEFFEQACAYYERAIVLEDKPGRAPIRAIEQLANFEARTGEQTLNVELIERAILRLKSLERAGGVEARADANSDTHVVNAERAALLGSAYKRLAAVSARRIAAAKPATEASAENEGPTTGGDGLAKELQDALEESLAYYGMAASRPTDKTIKPYNTLNWLFLTALTPTDERGQHVALARRCADAANKSFHDCPNVWDAIMAADACLVETLLDESLAAEGNAGVRVLDKVVNDYRMTTRDVRVVPRDLDSAMRQIEIMACLYQVTATTSPVAQRIAERLKDLAQRVRTPAVPAGPREED